MKYNPNFWVNDRTVYFEEHTGLISLSVEILVKSSGISSDNSNVLFYGQILS